MYVSLLTYYVQTYEGLWFTTRMAVDRWVDTGTFPLLFEVEGTPSVLSPPTFSGVDIFCSNTHGIRWMIGAIFVKFSQLIVVKIIKIVATRCLILRLKCTKFRPCWKS